MFNFFNKKKEPVKLFYTTDVHSHILPGIDHGSQSVEQSLEMLEAEMAMGISRVMGTSHVMAETFENTPATIKASCTILREAIAEHGLPITIEPSAEYRIDEYWDKEYEAGHILPLPGNWLLMENSFQQELLELDQLMFDIQCKGYRPILAHPERYSYYHYRRNRYETLHNAGVKFQVNLLSLAGYFGHHAKDISMWLIENNMVDMLGSDMHNMNHAEVIQDYLRSKEWAKIAKRLEPHIINDEVR